jgi:ABC-type Fe3+/spermidine/putrescine transport system ATPase subunit
LAELRVEGLSKSYDARAGAVVDDVSFSAADGEVISLLGPSGCGKTTTLRCIAGLEQPEAGSIYLEGRPITAGPKHLLSPEQRGMGMVFQSYSIWPHMTVGENIAIGLRAKKLKGADVARKVAEVLALVRLPGLEQRRATDLSGGQQQRVALARSLALEPKVLLFDEPLSNLDAGLREQMRFELRDLLKRLAITSIYVTHDQAEAFVVSDRVCVMGGGKIVQSGPPEEIYCRPTTSFVAEFIGSANLLDGTVVGTDVDHVLVDVEGQRLRAIGTASMGEAVRVCIRSEAMELTRQAEGGDSASRLAGRIAARAYLGNAFDYRVVVGATALRVSARPSVRLDVGEDVWLRIAPEDVLVLAERARPAAMVGAVGAV